MRIHAYAAVIAAFAFAVAHDGMPPVSTVPAVQKRAVLVGIDDYTASTLPASGAATPPDRDWEDLQGAVNDVGILRELLIHRFGFHPEDIVTLTNQEATRVAILNTLERELAAPARNGDVAFFYYAGHGSQVANSRSDEPDKLDESLVPADSRVGAPDLRDKELRRIFNKILDRGSRLTVVLDSCHSASGARGFDGGLRPRGIRADLRDVADGSDAGPRPEDRGALILSAAEDFDFAYEMRDPAGEVHGAFSWALENVLRGSASDESAIDTFLRVQARLRFDMPAQEPVLAGDREARVTPFLSARAEKRDTRSAIAVERIEPDGTYVLQGGWVNGITVGSELAAGDVHLEVTALRGIARAEARPVAHELARGESGRLDSGALLHIVAWAPPPSRPLRVWMPVAPVTEMAAASAFKRALKSKGVRWVTDPTESAATHVIRWSESAGAWELLEHGATGRIAVGTPGQIVQALPRRSSVFVQIPAPAGLVEAIGVRGQDGIDVTADPREADYILGGRLVGTEAEYAWLRRALTPAAGRAVLPPRSAWSSVQSRETPVVLNDAILRLRRIFGWQSLEGPPDAAHSYVLAIRRAADGSLVDNGVLVGRTRYGLMLRRGLDAGTERVEPRYVYVFVIDSHGKSILLYPLSGSVENRFPTTEELPLPPEIPLGESASFTAAAPYGVDTYFLLTTDDALPDPWALEWDGVRAAGEERGSSPLQDLLAAGGLTRSGGLRTPANWSLRKLVVESVPPEVARRAKRGTK